MSTMQDNRGRRSNSFRGDSSTIHANHRISHQTDRSISNSSTIRYGEYQNHHSYIRHSERRPKFDEQTRYAINNKNHHPHYGKRKSTTFNTSFDSPQIKRPCLLPVSYSTLVKLVNKSSDEILNELLHPNFQLDKLLNDKRMQERYDWIYSMTILLEKITKCIRSNERIRKVFEKLSDTLYLEGVYDEVPKVDPNTNQLRFNFIELFLKISNTFLVMIPYSADALTKIFERIELQFSKIKYESREFEVTKRILDEVLEEVKNIENRQKQKQELLNANFFNTTNMIATIQNDSNQPSDDYHQLSVVPNLTEILSEQRPYLRKNIVDGIYENAQQYLDIHFRLLREDFVGPLRDGIQQYLSKVPGKNSNIRIYENVYLLGSRLIPQSGLVYDLLLDSRIASKIYWANSRRLLYGNLLVLTFNNFQSCAFCTIEDRSQVEKKFIISVKTLKELKNFEQTQMNLDVVDRSCSLTMIETMVYFEAYHPVLNALQIIPSNHRFPLGSFLLKLTNEMTTPDYIKPTTTYDFTPLLVDLNSDVKASLIIHQTFLDGYNRIRRRIEPITTKEFKIEYKQTNQIDNKYKTICIVNKDEWPTSEELHLNPKQREALILALTNKVALIQGPPGTGKTFLGVRITEMLLYNRSVWCPSDEQSTPILMICHTNHALDQFLELIVKRLNIREGIIRVGSRCENRTIQEFSLTIARRLAKEKRSTPRDVYYEKHKILANKFETEKLLKLHQYEMERSQTNITPLQSFVDCAIIDDRHLNSLLGVHNDKTETVLLEWLGLYDEVEQISVDLTYKETVATNISRMEIDYNTEGKFEDNKDKNAEDEFNEEEEEEEERRRDELDMEEYDYMSSSIVRQSETVTVNRMNIEILSKYDNNSKRKSQTVRKNSNNVHRFIEYINQNPTTLNDETVKQIKDNVWQLSDIERYNLYGYWLLKYRQYLHFSIHTANQDHNEIVSDLAKIRQTEDYHILKDSIIIAMTTTCAAKYHKVLEKLQSKIVIVEEAAAIFEAHIITALSTKCEHLILIGDHVQLRPNPSVYNLGIKYNIDVSLFERLIKNNFPNVRLNIQHRMRPEIARLMKYFYDDLDDHISVKTDRASVRGIDNNLFFINHNNNETDVDDGRSKRNEYEAKYVIELAQYLIKQGYSPKQITILVMYLGQKQFIAKQTRQINLLRGVRIMVTDNYQGEENDIIILSLVRSNPEKKIGFLGIHNRICVALSRARCGLFVIGNMNLLAEVDDMWKNIFTSLLETKEIGTGLLLSCHQHPEPKFIADKPESFAQRPEGGCQKRCDARLKCGHQCQLKCHNNDFEHDEIVCHKRCSEKLSCGHPCTKRCHFETPSQHDSCHVLVEKTISECGHQIRIECCKTPTSNDCKQSSLIKLHCNHVVLVPCRILSLPSEYKVFPCPEPCGTILACQHKCVGTCGDCRTGKLHVPCGEKCERELICSHVCKVSCATNCPPCSRECQTRCTHSKCRNRCGDLCEPCRELCAYKCKHLRCTRLCYEPCNRGPCNEPCNKKLKCGHTCIGLCGEPCPSQCRICHKDVVQEIFFGSEDEPDARFVFLPDCKHIIEVTELDKFVKRFDNNSNDKTVIRFPECPRCRQKIHYCTRYMSIINKAHNLISQVKKKILGNSTKEQINNRRTDLIKEYEELQKNLIEINFDKSMQDFILLYKRKRFVTDDMLNLITNIIQFLNEIDDILIGRHKKLPKNIFEDLVNFPLQHIVKYLFKQQFHRNFAEQQLQDIQSELKRIRRVIYIETLIFSLKQTLKPNEKEGIDSMQYLTKKPGPFTDQDRQKFDDLAQQFEYLNNLPGLGITENERIAIVSALNMKQGHWYICPNGHPYVITECGGANQESQCPDCRERIGGQNHRLLETNRHFGLMDDSRHAAWSNEANLNLP
ncbi:unnamed protein product [Rotaria sp. Silwood1]|nr:unnamed protein product [Rotaria sp. Silwood1]